MPVLPINARDVPSQNKMTGARATAIARTGCAAHQPHRQHLPVDDAAESSPCAQTPPAGRENAVIRS